MAAVKAALAIEADLVTMSVSTVFLLSAYDKFSPVPPLSGTTGRYKVPDSLGAAIGEEASVGSLVGAARAPMHAPVGKLPI